MSGSGAGAPHQAEVKPDTAVTIGGRRHLKPLDYQHPDCWPAEAICRCGEMLRREAVTEPWVHAGRRPGELG